MTGRSAQDTTAFSSYVLAQRKAKKLTLEQVAEQSGTSKTYVWGLEHGRHVPSLLMAGRLARVLGTNVDYLYNLLTKDLPHYEKLRPGVRKQQQPQ